MRRDNDGQPEWKGPHGPAVLRIEHDEALDQQEATNVFTACGGVDRDTREAWHAKASYESAQPLPTIVTFEALPITALTACHDLAELVLIKLVVHRESIHLGTGKASCVDIRSVSHIVSPWNFTQKGCYDSD